MCHSINRLFISLIIFIVSVQLHAQEKKQETSCVPIVPLTEETLPFKDGEKMSFVMHYEWGLVNSDIGHATVSLDKTVLNGVPVYNCTVEGRTTKLYDLFFKVRENFASWFTVDQLRPVKFTRSSHEGDYHAENTYIYDWDAAEPVIHADLYSSKKGDRVMDIPLTPCTFDLPALFYFARNMDVDSVIPEKKYPMTFAIDDDIFNVYFIYHGKETIKLRGLGTVRTMKFSARLLAGEVFKSDTDMTIYISDDKNRLPVYFVAPILVGTASGKMTGYSGLKHPFESLIK